MNGIIETTESEVVYDPRPLELLRDNYNWSQPAVEKVYTRERVRTMICTQQYWLSSYTKTKGGVSMRQVMIYIA